MGSPHLGFLMKSQSGVSWGMKSSDGWTGLDIHVGSLPWLSAGRSAGTVRQRACSGLGFS